jgi:hypothetical protein
MRTKLIGFMACGCLVLSAVPMMAHHAFSAEFDATKPLKLEGAITEVEWINPHTWIHIQTKSGDGKSEEWMIEGGTPNTLLRRGFTEDSLKVGTVIKIDGYQAKDGTLKANGRDLTLPDGRKLFMGTSGTGAPTDGTDSADPAKPAGRGRGGR